MTPVTIGYKTSVESIQTITNGGPMDSPWPMFCYDKKNTGKSPYESSSNTLYEKWKFKLDSSVSFSSPVIDNNETIYIGSGHGTLYAINSNGTEKWRYETDELTNDMTTPALAADGTIYVAEYYGNLYALFPDGTEKWRTSLQRGIISSPVIADDGTIFTGGHEKFYAVLPNGSILWEYTTGNGIKASPAIGDDGTVYVASHDGYLYSFYPTNGTLKWKLKVAGGLECYSSPAIDENGIIYYGVLRYYFYAIYPNGTIKWKHEGGSGYYGGPVIDGGTIYVKGGDELHAYNSDGSVKWRYTTWTKYSAPAIANNGNIYTTKAKYHDGDENTMALISPSGEEIYSVDFPIDVNYGSATIGSNPAIGSDGTVYIGSWFTCIDPGFLHAFGPLDPNTPLAPTINGPTDGLTGKVYDYTFVTTDPNGDQVYYYVDWGDQTNSGWLGPYDSGENIMLPHKWDEYDRYRIKAKAKDTFDVESSWTTLSVSMTRNRPFTDRPFLNFLQNIIERFPLFARLLKLL